MKRTPLKRKPFKKKKQLSIPKLRDKVWVVFSKYIRLRGSVDGYGKCITCGIVKPITEMHAGHFQHSKNKEFYLDPDNCHCQCPKCNLYLSGNLARYTLFMLDEYGQDTVDRLLNSKPIIWKRDQLEELLETYKRKLSE